MPLLKYYQTCQVQRLSEDPTDKVELKNQSFSESFFVQLHRPDCKLIPIKAHDDEPFYFQIGGQPNFPMHSVVPTYHLNPSN